MHTQKGEKMKMNCCDFCFAEKKLVKAKGSFRVRHHRNLRIDYCAGCRGKIPKNIRDYVKVIYKVKFNQEVGETEITSILKG